MDRTDVFELINEECDYQDSRSERDIESDKDHSVADWILYMEFKLEEAKKNVYLLKEDTALELIRQVTTLGVRCMENNETLSRYDRRKRE